MNAPDADANAAFNDAQAAQLAAQAEQMAEDHPPAPVVRPDAPAKRAKPVPALPASRLLAEITCPNCWHRFPPEDILFIARHDDLIGDPVAGETAYRRFLPTRFNIHGDALDAKGMACQALACPRCHLEISRPLIEMNPHFISIVGVPASGKSYFLAAMTWELRRMATRFGFTLADGDPTANVELQRSEEVLFMNPDPDTAVTLRKTEITGEALYQTIFLESQRQQFPRPFQFTVQPTRVTETTEATFPYRALVLYDNAGEHFLPGQDQTNSPVTLHLAESAASFFLFDPTQDPRFRHHCHSNDPQLKFGTRPGSPQMTNRQEVILNEMAARVRKYKGIGQTQRHKKPLVMILAKADVWIDEEGFDAEPILPADREKGLLARLDAKVIQTVSDNCRKLMDKTCPEIVAAAEGFSERVVYIPSSALGGSPELVETEDGGRFLGIKPKAVRPKWVTIPMLWALSQTVPGLVGIE